LELSRLHKAERFGIVFVAASDVSLASLTCPWPQHTFYSPWSCGSCPCPGPYQYITNWSWQVGIVWFLFAAAFYVKLH